MVYTEGQIDRLRLKLCEYRAQKGANGRMRPWKSVIDDILMSDATQHDYPVDGSFPEFKEEAIRRFAAGSSVPSDDKLEDIYNFLKDQKFLSDDELTNGVWDFTAALSLRNLFGKAATASETLGKVTGNYRAEIKSDYKGLEGFTRYEMDFRSNETEAMFEIDQRYFTWLYEGLSDAELEKRYGDQIRFQKGYGFPSSSNELTIFLKDGLTGKTDICLITDIADRQPVQWFQAVVVNNQLNIKSNMPSKPSESHSFDKWLYRAHSLERGR